MTAKLLLKRPVLRRLLPLYIGIFLQGFVLWYAIEKLFMVHIGFNDATIGVMFAAYSALMLLIETPSGILADRWSRKGVLMLSSLALVISSIICGLSNDVFMYIIGALGWGVYYALYTGTYDSIIYDTLVEETGESKGFEKYLGRLKVIESVSLVAGSLVGGLVSQLFGLQAAFLWTVPIALASMIALWAFREPQLHKTAVAEPLKQHVVNTFKAILNQGTLLWLLIALTAITLIIELVYEFQQLWLIHIGTSPVLFGPAYALVLSAIGIGGLLAPLAARKRHLSFVIIVSLMMISGLVLMTVPLFVPLVLAHTIVAGGAVILSVLCMHTLHDSLPSNVRAGASSALSTIARVALVPISLIFGAISQAASIFTASGIIVVLIILIAICLMRTNSESQIMSGKAISQ
jgi:predicted MFS family arabinose efflux permease